MKKKVTCYLHAQRRAWALTQNELACLVGRGGRNRVSLVERGLAQPNGGETLAYSLIFGVRPAKIFPQFCEDLEDAVMRGAAKLEKKIAKNNSAKADRKRELIDLIGARATGSNSLTAV
jgi:transcriptional regulator with XRE-family HTH domain